MPTPPSGESDGIAQDADLERQTRPAHGGDTGNSAAIRQGGEADASAITSGGGGSIDNRGFDG